MSASAARILPLLLKLPPTPRLIAQVLMIIGYAAILYWKLHSTVSHPFIVIVVATAWLTGGRDERRAAPIFGGAWAATMAAHFFLGDWRYHGVFVIDVVMLCALFWVSMRAERLWPLWATAFQSLTVTIHLIYFLAPSSVDMYAYGGGQVICAASMLLALLFGVWDAWTERRARSRVTEKLPTAALGLKAK